VTLVGEVFVSTVLVIFRSELRRRWRSWVILVVLVAVVGGLALAAVAAGRRTASAFPRFVADHGYDVYIFNDKPVAGLAKLPGVGTVTSVVIPGYGPPTCACKGQINFTDFYVNELSPSGLHRVVKLVAGRMPDPASTDQVLASFTLEQDFGIHVGSVIHVPFYSTSQQSALQSNGAVAPTGPKLAFHVVGIAAAEFEFPSGQTPEYDLFTTPAFARAVNPKTIQAAVYLIRLRHGENDLPRFAAAMTPKHVVYVSNQDTTAEAVAQSIRPQAYGWWILALLAALGGLAVVGQALGRQSVVESEEYPKFVALGMPRRQLIALGSARNVVIAMAGALGAVVLAFALSPLAPVGEARLAEPSPGLDFDPLVLLVGALAIVIVVAALGLWPSVRASRVRVGESQSGRFRRSPIVTRLSGTSAPPSALIGVRHALERGRGVASVPVGTALFGTVIAVTALCATAVFGTSLSHLTTTPKLYGQDYQLDFNFNQGNPTKELAAVQRDREVTGIMIGTEDEISINGVSVLSVAGKALRGPLLISKVDGRLPSGVDDISLGNSTLRQVHAHVGSNVRATFQVPTGGTRTVSFHVVGTASFPSSLALGGLGTGAALTQAGFVNALCPSGPSQASCLKDYGRFAQYAVAVRMAPGAKGRADIKHYLRAYPGVATIPSTPIPLINFGEAVNFPLILGAVLALLGAATLLNLLVVSVARRRREIGLLKALGFVKKQVGATVCWQATTVALVGIVLGVPLGAAIGQVVWHAFSANLGAVPVSVVPVGVLALLGAGVLVVANLLAFVPAVVAARSTTSSELFRAL
jgi:ABC-type lipoprotein release transport system permease subunit